MKNDLPQIKEEAVRVFSVGLFVFYAFEEFSPYGHLTLLFELQDELVNFVLLVGGDFRSSPDTLKERV